MCLLLVELRIALQISASSPAIRTAASFCQWNFLVRLQATFYRGGGCTAWTAVGFTSAAYGYWGPRGAPGGPRKLRILTLVLA